MLLWAKSDKQPSGGSLGEWVYKPIRIPIRLPKTSVRTSDIEMFKTQSNPYMPTGFSAKTAEEELILIYAEKMRASGLVMAKTPGAAQRNWSTPSEFPCCPQSTEENPITAYAEKLTTGVVFARNHFSTSVVLESAIADDSHSIWVMNQQAEAEALKRWSVAKVTYEDGLYVHTSCGSFFTKDGAEKKFYIARGFQWAGGDTIDDYC
ncbi:MAG: hypothetical protein HYX61_13360 [Gammaproteobacteria bacterium]|jgi:hypothetical protein|nr:hypothetical protein [Gammaproteobacteria bacterium]